MKFLKTISVDKFREILNNYTQADLSSEKVPLDNCFNKVAAEKIESPINVPHFRKSRMDGYAVIAEDTFGAEEDNLIPLKNIEKIEAGDTPTKKLHKGECAYVATGAAIPEGANSVVMVEFTDKEDDKILVSKAVTPGKYIVNVGHDIKKGENLLAKGKLIDLPAMGVLSGCGITEIEVFQKPKVSLLSTGSELVTHDVEDLEIGKIYDINSTVIKQAIKNTGAKVHFLGIVKDDFENLRSKINEGMDQSDIVILSGGTSKGEGDLAVRVLEEFENIEVQVHGVKIKPGKPIIFAKLREKYIFILPGYPTSALSCFYVFIDDFLRKLSGKPLRSRFSEKLEVGERIYSPVGRHHFKPVQIRKIKGKKMIFPIKTGSEAISTLFYSDGYVEIEELHEIVEKGDKLQFYTY